MKLSLAYLFLLFAAISCTKGPLGQVPQNCCESESTISGDDQFNQDLASTDESVKVSLFMANAFTPNGDGFDDTYPIRPFNAEVTGLTIKNSLGREIRTFTEAPFEWDGHDDKGKLRYGTFNLVVDLKTKNGGVGTVEAQVCSIECVPESLTDKCFYPSQIHPRLGLIVQDQGTHGCEG